MLQTVDAYNVLIVSNYSITGETINLVQWGWSLPLIQGLRVRSPHGASIRVREGFSLCWSGCFLCIGSIIIFTKEKYFSYILCL